MLTQAIMIGMTPQQFWKDDPELFSNYLDAYNRKKEWQAKADANKINTLAWLTGIYVLRARQASPALGKPQNYPDKPIDLSDDEPEERVSTMSDEKREQFELDLAKAQFEAFGRYAELYNETYYSGEEEGK